MGGIMNEALETDGAIPLDKRILTLREQKIILDADLAELYGVATKALNQAVKRNVDRFPSDFCFLLSPGEKDERLCRSSLR